MHGNKSLVDVRQLVEEVVEFVALPDGFRVSIHADVPSIETYRTPLFQVLLNLVSNAIKHHDKATGNITVEVSDRPDHLAFRVQDDGPGIAPKFHDRVWRVFETLRPRDDAESTGIGLAIVQKVVASYGGDVTLSSQENAGTTISFSWPKTITVLNEAST